MYKVTVLYGKPDDPRAFDDYYWSTHMPIARTMSGLTGWNLTWVTDQEGELAPSIHLIVDLYAQDREAMQAILDSPEGRAAREDVPNFATGGATMLFGDEEPVVIA